MTHLQKLLAGLPAGADAVLVSNGRNQRWLTGFPFDDGFVFVTKGNSYLLTDSRYIEAAQAGCDPAFVVDTMKGTRKDMFSRLCDENGVKTVLFEDTWTSVASFEGCKKWFEGYELVPAGKLIEDIREYKDEEEFAKIEAAQRIAEQAFDHILGFINPDRTEIDVALELEFFMRSRGAEGISFNTIAVSGSASSLPHGVPRPVKLEKGFLTMDYGALYDGYCSDMTRTVVIGKATEEQKHVYALEKQMIEDAQKEMRAGASLKKVYEASIACIKDTEYFQYHYTGIGHGIGMFVHEIPFISPKSETYFEAGNVQTIEPGLYIPGWGGIRIEDQVLITENGYENMISIPHDLIEL